MNTFDMLKDSIDAMNESYLAGIKGAKDDLRRRVLAASRQRPGDTDLSSAERVIAIVTEFLA